jgi:formylglycine-generating enzyme required for sulfatase activity
MELVAGNYCPLVEQRCVEHHTEWGRAKAQVDRQRAAGEDAKTTASERCLRYAAPSKCLSRERRPMRFCIDRYEWPNEKGALPLHLVSWYDAAAACEGAGKRLCSADEFNFACEGEEMLPYTYGYERDASKCNIDKPYIKREKNPKRYAECMEDEICKAEIARLDQREPAGSRPGCVSPFGVHDMNGNVNEWVVRPFMRAPERSGLKSGWWGPIRARCRPMTTFHKESDYGYEVGFRCCKDAAAP